MPIETTPTTVTFRDSSTGDTVLEWPALEHGGVVSTDRTDLWLEPEQVLAPGTIEYNRELWEPIQSIEPIQPTVTWAVSSNPHDWVEELEQRIRVLERDRERYMRIPEEAHEEPFEDPIAPIQPKEQAKKRKTRDTMEVNAEDFNLLAFGG